MSNEVARLRAVYRVGVGGGRKFDWPAVESRLGLVLPEDYKEVVDAFPGMYVAEFIKVLRPESSEESLDAVEGALGHREDLQEEYDDPDYRSLFPDRVSPRSLHLWAITDNGDYCYWVTDAADPNAWTVAVSTGKGWYWSFFEGGMVDFLVALFDGIGRLPDALSHFAEGGASIRFDDL